MSWFKVKPVIDYSVRQLCIQPYVNHPKGCPNYNKKDGCPPKVMRFPIHVEEVYVIWIKFNLGKHVQEI